MSVCPAVVARAWFRCRLFASDAGVAVGATDGVPLRRFADSTSFLLVAVRDVMVAERAELVAVSC